MQTKQLAQINISRRLRQVGWLVVLVLIGIAISVSTSAQSRFTKKKAQSVKARYKQQESHSPRACNLLQRKRNETENTRVVARKSRKPRYKPTAEVDPPGFVRDAFGGPAVASVPGSAVRER